MVSASPLSAPQIASSPMPLLSPAPFGEKTERLQSRPLYRHAQRRFLKILGALGLVGSKLHGHMHADGNGFPTPHSRLEKQLCHSLVLRIVPFDDRRV
jgi:hypothetical protein